MTACDNTTRDVTATFQTDDPHFIDYSSRNATYFLQNAYYQYKNSVKEYQNRKQWLADHVEHQSGMLHIMHCEITMTIMQYSSDWVLHSMQWELYRENYNK